MAEYPIEHYLTADGQKNLYIGWLQRLRDTQAKVAIIRRVARVEHGNFGDHKLCRDGVWEPRIDVGPGYRVYYGLAEQAHLNPTQLYRTLSPKGNPALSSLTAILKAMGLRLAVQPLAPATTPQGCQA